MLRALLRQRHWQTYSTFCAQYDKVARTVDPNLVGSWPSRAQQHRWLSGSMAGLPYPDHCRILEKMFPGWTADQLFAPFSGGALAQLDHTDDASRRESENEASGSYADLEAVFATRAEFNSNVPMHKLFDQAQDIRAAGLSLNMLFQQYPDRKLTDQISEGTRLRCLFLDPDGDAIKDRENEEGHTPGHLAMLGQLNLKIIRKVQERLPAEARDRVEVRLYDETVRFNITLIDHSLCIVQPYLPDARGVDSPTFVIRRKTPDLGLYRIFEHVYNSLWERGKPA
jgi:uncharacterized protein DUF5919